MGDEESAPGLELEEYASNDGFPALANFLARDPDSETFVFRKFSKWTARTLLYQQAELVALEAELAGLDRKLTAKGDIDIDLSMRSWQRMQSKARTNEDIARLIALSKQMESKLQLYHESLLRQAGISQLEGPSERVLSAYRSELHNGLKISNDGSMLGALDREILDDETDLAALKPPAHSDILARTIRRYWPARFRSKTSQEAAQTWHFEERAVVYTAGVISTIIAGTLLVGSILALYWTVNPDARLGLVLTFIVLFALSVSICTGASRDAVFAATAAYAAVLVVFVSGNLGNTNTNILSSTAGQ